MQNASRYIMIVIMNNKNYTVTFSVDQTPEEVFTAINNVRGWWSEEIEGDTDKQGSVFYYHFKDLHRSTIKVTELVLGKKVAWKVLQNYFSFVKDATEWTETEIVFEIAEKDGKTELAFTHIGLVPEYECYNACSEGWGNYIKGSLHDLITTGKGKPNAGEAITDSEQKLS